MEQSRANALTLFSRAIQDRVSQFNPVVTSAEHGDIIQQQWSKRTILKQQVKSQRYDTSTRTTARANKIECQYLGTNIKFH